MDYPSPIIMINPFGRLEINSTSYLDKIGIFDKISVDYAYRQFTHDDFLSYLSHQREDVAKDCIYSDEEKDFLLASERLNVHGYSFMTDEDLDTGDWRVHQWDTGKDPIAGEKTISTFEYFQRR